MAEFKITGEDGASYTVTAPDADTAFSAFKKMQSAAPKGAQGFANSYASQGATGFNEGLAGLLASPGDLGNFASRSLGFGEPFYGSRDLVGDMSAAGMISPESADPSKRVVRAVGSAAGASVLPAGGMLRAGAAAATQAAPAATSLGGAVSNMTREAARHPGAFMAAEAGASVGAGIAGQGVAEVTDNPAARMAGEVIGGVVGGAPFVPRGRVSGNDAVSSRMLQKRMEDDGISTEDLRAAGAGAGARTVDMGGENVQRFAGAVKRAPGRGKNILSDSAQMIFDGERKRMTRDSDQALGVRGTDFYKQVGTVESRRKAQARRDWRKAYATEFNQTDTSRSLMSRPAMQDAVKEAERAAANEGVEFYDSSMLRGMRDEPVTSDELDMIQTRREVSDFFKRYDELEKSTSEMWKRPAAGAIKRMLKGRGVDPSGALAKELYSRDINPKTFPGLFKKNGVQSLDNIPASELPDFARDRSGDLNGYISEQDFVDALEADFKGSPIRSPEEKALIDEFNSMESSYDEFDKLSRELPEPRQNAAPEKQMTMRGLDLTVRRLGQKIEKAVKNEDGDEARRLTDLKVRFLREVDEQNPSYAKARKLFSEESNLLGAFDDGRKYMRGDVETLTARFGEMNEAQKDAFRLGVARQLREQTGTLGGRSRILKDDGVKEKLTAIMEPEQAGKFLARVALRKNQRAANNKMVGGSPTAENIAEDAALSDDVISKVDLDILRAAKGGVVNAVATGVMKYLGTAKAATINGLRSGRAASAAKKLAQPARKTANELDALKIKDKSLGSSRFGLTGANRFNAILRAGATPNEDR